MSQQIGKLQTLTGGISTISSKLGPPNSFAWGRAINFRSDPAQQTTYPQSVKISGSIVTDLPMFGDTAHDANAVIGSQTNTLFFHGNTGNIYAVNTSDVVTKEYTVPNSSGNGIVYFAETNQLYIPTNTSITRRDMTTGNYYDHFLETSGGAPTNLNALLLVAASSQSATRASTASLQLAGDMTLEAYLKPTSLPTGSNKMTIISKWDESGTKLGYKLDIIATSAAFGDGSDGSLTISVNTTDTPIDSACTGTAGAYTLIATNVSFAANQVILIHQTQGTNAGQWEKNTISGYTAGTITLSNPLSATYTAGAQVLVMKQYSSVTINSSIIWKPKAWTGTTGGILAFLCSGTFTNNGTIRAGSTGPGTGYDSTARGYRGYSSATPAPGVGSTNVGYRGEGTTGNDQAQTTANQGSGGGGGNGAGGLGAGGGGGGNGTAGNYSLSGVAAGGAASGSADLTTMTFGGAGGNAGGRNGDTGGQGGPGGGIVFINSVTLTNSGTISTDGSDGQVGGSSAGSGGGGAGGSILLKGQTITEGTLYARGGVAGANFAGTGGNGGDGRIHLDYSTSITAGTVSPALTSAMDSLLGAANGYALRLYISSDGTAFETYTQNISSFIGVYKFYSVSWKASTSTAIFYENAQAIGTKVGALTAINTNSAIFGIGCYVNSGSAKTGFYDGLIDDVRVWNAVRTPAQIANYYDLVLSGLETNLVAYYPFDGAVTDAQTSGLNNLTANNAPTYSSDVAFKGVTTRGDQDISSIQSGQLYTLKTALSETATDKLSFVPTKEPFKSLALNIDTIGTGNWTVAVHDALNNVVATMTVLHADIQTGVYEFKFASTARIVLNATYHIHVFDTTGDGKVVTHTVSDFSTAYLATYFQILVNDPYHMAVQFQNFACIANERYLATLQAGNVYNPVRLIFPSGYRIRSLAFWQQYIVIGMWFGNNVTDTDKGKLFFWDGSSDTYIDSLDIPQGGINAMLGTQGGLLISAGYKGAILEYTGYPSSFRYTARTSAQLVFRLPNVAQGDTVEIAPGAMTMWNSMNRIGVALNSNSSTIHNGIYSYGQYTDQDPMSVGFDNPLSIGDNTNTSVKVGCLVTRNAKLYTGFQNGNTFGIDVVSESANPYPTGTVEYLITDLGSVSSSALPFVFRQDFLPLVSGQSVTLKWKPNRNSSWLPITTQSKVGATNVRGVIDQRINEAQFAMDWVNTTTPVTFTQSTLESEGEEDSIQV